MPMTLKVTLDPFRSVDMPLSLVRVLLMSSNIVCIQVVFSTGMRYGYDDDAKDALYILEETVKHSETRGVDRSESS